MNSPQDVAAVYRNTSTLIFDTYVRDLMADFGVSPSAVHKMFESPVMDRDYFMRLADSFRSPHLWKREADQWKLRHSVFDAA